MSSGCGNCDCADKSQCTKKRNNFGVEIVETTTNMSYGAEMGENDCKCGPSCTCTGCTCHNALTWSGYAQNGFCKDALKLIELMKHSGAYPDHVSFACVLFACSHAGLVDEGCKYFNGMSDSYCFMPKLDHYVCMVDLLGRAGYLEETLNFIIKMPIKPVVVVWMCLLGACRSHKNIGIGLFTATLLFEMDPKNAATYVLLSNIYAEVSRWGEVQKVRRLMIDRGIEKIPGCSWIEVHKLVHTFCVGDRSHPRVQEISAKLEKLSWEIKTEQQNIFQIEDMY